MLLLLLLLRTQTPPCVSLIPYSIVSVYRSSRTCSFSQSSPVALFAFLPPQRSSLFQQLLWRCFSLSAAIALDPVQLGQAHKYQQAESPIAAVPDIKTGVMPNKQAVQQVQCGCVGCVGWLGGGYGGSCRVTLIIYNIRCEPPSHALRTQQQQPPA